MIDPRFTIAAVMIWVNYLRFDPRLLTADIVTSESLLPGLGSIVALGRMRFDVIRFILGEMDGFKPLIESFWKFHFTVA